MRLLVTGANGFVGRHAIEAFGSEAEIYALGRTAPATVAEFVEHDLTQPLDTAVLPTEIDAIVSLAQARDYRDFPAAADEVFQVNVTATMELLQYAQSTGIRTFVSASTGGVYGRTEHAREDQPLHPAAGPLAFYLNTKLAAELLVQSYASEMRTVILRPFFPYGPGPSSMLIRTLAERVLAGEPVRITGKPGLIFNPVYVGDLALAVRAAVESTAEGVFNVAGDEALSLTDLVERIGVAAGVKPDILHVEGESAQLVADTARLHAQLGAPVTPLAEGLAQLVADIR